MTGVLLKPSENFFPLNIVFYQLLSSPEPEGVQKLSVSGFLHSYARPIWFYIIRSAKIKFFALLSII